MYFAFTIDNLALGFYLFLFASGLVGSLTNIDTVVFMGYLSGFTEFYLSAFYPGQAFSGLSSNLIYFGVREIKFEFKYVCLLMIPLNLLRYTLFAWMDCLKEGEITFKKNENQEILGKGGDKILNRISIDSVLRVLKNGRRLLANVLLCNYLKYICLSGFSDRSTIYFLKSKNLFERNGFVLLKISLAVGDFLGKFSLFCFRLKTLEVTTIPLLFFMVAFGYFAFDGHANIFL